MATARAVRIRDEHLRRSSLAATAGSFRAAGLERTRMRVRGGHGDHHADDRSRGILIDLSRDLFRNAEPYTIIIRGTARLIGAPTPRPTTRDREWNQLVARQWAKRASLQQGGFDDRGLDTWYSLCAHWWLSALRDGDVSAVPLEDGTIATYEADQMAGGPRVGNQHRRTIGGVTIDGEGRPLQAWYAPRTSRGFDEAAAQPLDWDVIRYLSFRWQVSQTRGLPLCTAGLDNTERIDGLIESEVISAEQASNIYGALKRVLASGSTSGQPAIGTGAQAMDHFSGDDGQGGIEFHDWNAGTYLDLPPGVEWESIASNRPNLDVVEMLRSMLNMSAAQTGIPYPLLFADFKDCSWSVNRGLVSLARDALAMLRTYHCEPFIDPFYGWWLERELATGRIPQPSAEVDVRDPEALYAHQWDWPVRPEWPDPLKEEQTHEIGMRNGTRSLHRILGPDWMHVQEERLEEQMLADAHLVRRYVALAKEIGALRSEHPDLPIDLTPEQVLAGAYSPAAAPAPPPVVSTTDGSGAPVPPEELLP